MFQFLQAIPGVLNPIALRTAKTLAVASAIGLNQIGINYFDTAL